MRVRPAGPADAEAIAGLHAASWRRAYRGILSDAYLSGPLAEERGVFWRERLERADPSDIVLVAEGADGPVAFLCVVVAEDPTWGTLIDNLHVDAAHQGRGIGRDLVRAALRQLEPAALGTALHLYAYEANHAARAIYERWGGAIEARHVKPTRDGGAAPVLRYVWQSAAALRDRLG